MGLDINKIINEAIEETLEEDNEVIEEVNEVIEEVSDEAKKRMKIGAGVAGVAGAAGAGALAATDRGQAAISKAGEAVSAGASAAQAGAGKAYDATKAAAGKAVESGRQKVLDKTMSDSEKAQMSAGSVDNLAKVKKSGLEDASAKELAGEAYKDYNVAANKAVGRLTSATKSIGTQAKEDLTRLGKRGMDATRKMFGETAIASSLSAGLGAKTIVEQFRKLNNK